MASLAQPSLKPEDLFGVKGLVAVVTGGGTGVGLMMAEALESNGATVFIIGRRQNKLDQAAQNKANHGRIIPIQGDVTSKTDLSRITSAIAAHPLSGGVVNLVVANVGVQGPVPPKSLDAGSPDRPSLHEAYEALWAPERSEFDAVFSSNVSGTYFTAVAFLPLLHAGNEAAGNARRASSQIIVTGSAASYLRDASGMFAYGASKAATDNLVRRLATTLVPYHIRVNSIVPGIFPSEVTEDLVRFFDGNPSAAKAMLPLGRYGTIEDMAGLILWLASRAGGYVSGSFVLSDGGVLSLRPASY
ncbi:hypothetical protein KJ359_006497 [Pestalotiopsis sp. 9143b]|nr:hypothetical protein KJ359_006497 [Pestalotiopsis sp. 9143b]